MGKFSYTIVEPPCVTKSYLTVTKPPGVTLYTKLIPGGNTTITLPPGDS